MALSDYQDIIHRCFRCGFCKFPASFADINNCPAYARFRLESFSPGGRLWLIRAWLNGELAHSERLKQIVFSCTACANCSTQCPYRFGDQVLDMILAAKNEMLERGLAHSALKDFLENVYRYGNPYGEPREKRAGWAAGLGLETYNQHEFLYYVGCVGSYDTRSSKAARALGAVLRRSVSAGILGPEEPCDGHEAAKLGEEGLFEHLARENIRQFTERGVRKIVALSPHAYNAIKNDYPRFGGRFDVVHYTQLLRGLIHGGRLKFPRRLEAKAAYHDPCFLGRWNEEYEAPRAVLRSIPGLKLIEMPRNRKSALCCGGGGANFYTDLLGGGEEAPARIRVREAHATGADILATACPICLTMLDDAAKTEGLEGKLAIKDIAEIVEEASQTTA